MPEGMLLLLRLPLLFPDLWPLKADDPLLLLWLVFFLGAAGGRLARIRKNGKKWDGKKKRGAGWLFLTLAGLYGALTDPDKGALLAAFFQQLCWGVDGYCVLRRGIRQQNRKKYRKGLVLVTAAFWIFALSFFFVLPEPVYWILWVAALVVLDWIFPQVSRR